MAFQALRHDDHFAIAELLVTVFLFITAPVSANFVAKAAMHLKVEKSAETRGHPWDQ